MNLLMEERNHVMSPTGRILARFTYVVGRWRMDRVVDVLGSRTV